MKKVKSDAVRAWDKGEGPAATVAAPKSTLDEILADRRKTHGLYRDQAALSYALKTLLRSRSAHGAMSNMLPDQIEAIEMICVKLARITMGNPDHADAWRDIAGYATLVADRLENIAERE